MNPIDWLLVSALVVVTAGCLTAFSLMAYRRGIRSAWLAIERQQVNTSKQFQELVQLQQVAIQESIAPKPHSYERMFRAQHGEDILAVGMLAGISGGVFLEAGAYDGLTFSNTLGLEALGWRGVLVEPIPERFNECQRNRPKCEAFNALLGAEDQSSGVTFWVAEAPTGGGMLSSATPDNALKKRWEREGCSVSQVNVPQRTINTLLEESGFDRIDFLSLDLEGGELEALKGLDLAKYSPALLCIEDAPEDSEIASVLSRHGYEIMQVWHGNSFFRKAQN